jgi:hypothetical protein
LKVCGSSVALDFGARTLFPVRFDTCAPAPDATTSTATQARMRWMTCLLFKVKFLVVVQSQERR